MAAAADCGAHSQLQSESLQQTMAHCCRLSWTAAGVSAAKAAAAAAMAAAQAVPEERAALVALVAAARAAAERGVAGREAGKAGAVRAGWVRGVAGREGVEKEAEVRAAAALAVVVTGEEETEDAGMVGLGMEEEE